MIYRSNSSLVVFLTSLVLCLAMSLARAASANEPAESISSSQSENSRIVRFTTESGDRVTVYDKGFLVEKPQLSQYPPILHVQGVPYEMGYQHGVLLADRIEALINGVGSPMMFMMGGWAPSSGQPPTQEQLQAGRALCELAVQRCFLQPIREKVPDYYEEMRGMADGLKAVGSPVGLDEILAAAAMAELSQSPALAAKLADELNAANAPEAVLSQECSDFAAWGKATSSGKLIHGTNYDNEDFTIGRHGVVLIAKPQSGNAFLGMIHPGSPWPMRGMSEAGITVGEPTSVSADNDILAHPQVGHCAHMRRVLQYANSTQDAIAIMKEFGGTTGWNIFVTDGKVPTAVDIQVSCTKAGVIYPAEGRDLLWSTNQFTAYPGYQGYPDNGPNLVKDQMRYWGVPWEQVDTIEKWQEWLRKNRMSPQADTWARYERLRALGNEDYGNITVEKVIAFMSDPVLSSADERMQLSPPVKHLYGTERPIISQKMASIFSAVFVPGDGMAYVAMGAEPAQAGKYWPINLKAHIALINAVAQETMRERTENTLKKLFEGGIEKP